MVNPFYVRKLEGHERASRQSISSESGTNRKPMNKSIILEGQTAHLSCPGMRLLAKTGFEQKTCFCFFFKEYKIISFVL